MTGEKDVRILDSDGDLAGLVTVTELRDLDGDVVDRVILALEDEFNGDGDDFSVDYEL